MNAVPFMTPNSFNFEPVIIRKEYKAVYGSNFYNIIIEKTNNNIIIRLNYFEIKLNNMGAQFDDLKYSIFIFINKYNI